MTVCPRHNPSCGFPIALEVPTPHGIALKTLTTRGSREVKVKVKGRIRGSKVGGIEDPGAAACPLCKVGRAAREVTVKINGRIKGEQVGGIVDPGAAARPVRNGGKATKVTRDPREKRVKWFPMPEYLPCRPRRLIMSFMAAL